MTFKEYLTIKKNNMPIAYVDDSMASEKLAATIHFIDDNKIHCIEDYNPDNEGVTWNIDYFLKYFSFISIVDWFEQEVCSCSLIGVMKHGCKCNYVKSLRIKI